MIVYDGNVSRDVKEMIHDEQQKKHLVFEALVIGEEYYKTRNNITGTTSTRK